MKKIITRRLPLPIGRFKSFIQWLNEGCPQPWDEGQPPVCERLEVDVNLYYISFADNENFRGCTVVEGETEAGALATASRQGLNPGGEAMIILVPPEQENEPDVKAMLNKLVNKEEMQAMGELRHGDIEQPLQAALESGVTIVCEDCNQPRKDMH